MQTFVLQGAPAPVSAGGAAARSQKTPAAGAKATGATAAGANATGKAAATAAKPGSAAAAKTPTPAAGPFKITRVTPTGPAQSQHAPIKIVFSSDVVSTETLLAGRSAPGVLSFDPSIDGYAEWASPRVLQFLPEKSLRAGTRYMMRVSPTLTDVAKRKLTGTTEYSFETQPLELEEVEQSGFTKERRVIVSLKFSDDVSPADLEKYLTFRSGEQTLNWKPQKDVLARKILVETDPLATDSLTLILQPGMQGAGGPLGLTEKEERPVSLEFKMIPEKLTAKWSQDKASLSLKFSNSPRMDDIKKYLQIAPEVPFEVVSDYDSIRLTGDFKPETRYTVTVKSGLMGTNEEMLFREVSMSAWIPAMKPFLELKDAGGHLSSAGTMKLRVRSAQVSALRVSANRLYDNNLVFFANEYSERDGYGLRKLGHPAGSKVIELSGGKGAADVQSTEVDLRQVLGDKPEGIYYVNVRAVKPEKKDAATSETASAPAEEEADEGDESDEPGSRLHDGAVIAVSNLGITGKRGSNEVTVWVTSLTDAKPVQGAKVRAYSTKNQQIAEAETDGNGLATITGLSKVGEKQADVVVAQLGQDVAYLHLGTALGSTQEEDSAKSSEDNETGERDYLRKGYEAFVSPERGVYRPGELVHVLGMVRGKNGSVPDAFPLELQVERPDNRKWDPIPVTATSSGTLVSEIKVPDFAQTGLYTVRVQLGGTAAKHGKGAADSASGSSDPDEVEEVETEPDVLGSATFRVEEFLPNRLKVETTAADARFSRARPLTVAVNAQEMFGQAAAGRTVTGTALFYAEAFKPKGFAGYTFGDTESKYEPAEKKLPEQTTDANGGASVTVELPKKLPSAALRADVQITVKDIGGRAVTSMIERKFDPVPYYLGARLKADTFAQVSKPAEFEFVAVRPDGTAIDSTELTGTISRVRYNSILKREEVTYRYVTKRELELVHEFTATIRDKATSSTWTPTNAGAYLLKVSDPATGALTALPFYVSSPQWGEQPWSMEKPESLELVLDKQEYAPGQTAKLLVKSPFAGTLLLTLEQDRVLSSSVITMTENTYEVSLPVDASMAPNFYCVASVVRAVKPEEKWLPHRAYGSVDVELSADHQRLAIDINKPEETRPQGKFEASILVKDVTTSNPASAELVVWAVDEGILSLTEFDTPDPLDVFAAVRRLMVTTSDFFSDLMPEIVERVTAKSATGGDEAGGRKLSPIRGERVKPVVVWKGIVNTDAQGNAKVSMDVPQFMGQLRIMAVAAAGAQFGSGDSHIFVRNPIMIKESLPRFMAPGDDVTIPFVIYNNTDTAQAAKLSVQTSGVVSLAADWKDGSRETDSIPARSMVTVPVHFTAAKEMGLASISFEGTMGSERYADSVTLPVRPAMPSVYLSGIDSVAAGETKSISIPQARLASTTTSGSLIVSGLPTVQLASALKYLYYYKYGCLEQTCSSAFPLLFLPDVANLLEEAGTSRYAVETKVQWAVDRVLSMQLTNGSLAMWPGSRDTWDWGTVYGAHFLVEAKKAGYVVSDTNLNELLDYLRSHLGSFSDDTDVDGMTERCYAALVLATAGKRNLERQEALFEARSRLTPSARALLASSFVAAGNAQEARTLIAERMTFQTTETKRQTGGILSSPVRELALLLSATLDANASAAEVPQLVARLQKLRGRDGHWGTTQDNSFAIYALSKYAKKMQGTAQSFTGTVTAAGSERFDFVSSEPLRIPIKKLGATAGVQVSGEGRAYVSWDVEGVPLAVDTTSVSRGLAVERVYLDRNNKRLDPAKLKQGDLVIVQINLKSNRELNNLVIEDLLPAGLEVENANLASSEKISDDSSDEESGSDESSTDKSDDSSKDESSSEESSSDSSDEENHESGVRVGGLAINGTEGRDDRMLGFVDLVGTNGTYKGRFRYAARAVSQGSFALPPVQASCMYDPEVQARNSAGVAQVVGK